MNTNVRSTSISQSKQMSTDSDTVVQASEPQGRVMVPTLSVQTGIRAGARGDWKAFVREEAEIR
jgi:hypothetical protein